jgi:hypothetical protein
MLSIRDGSACRKPVFIDRNTLAARLIKELCWPAALSRMVGTYLPRWEKLDNLSIAR